jgi:hypothetical protein
MEQHLGRSLASTEHVHHKNQDQRDNRIENLEVVSNSEHARKHHEGDVRTMVRLTCPVCLKVFERERRQTFLVKGGSASCCGRSCGAFWSNKTEEWRTQRLSTVDVRKTE